MLREETVEKGTLDLIKRLMADKEFEDFNLVGGTALALKIGHRKSIDIDLFTTKDFNARKMGDHIARNYHPSGLQVINNGVACFIEDIKVDVLAHQYPLVKNVEAIQGIRLISLEDIGAMKLNAIYNNGTRLKDFVDIHCLLQYYSLRDLIKACGQKYPDINGQVLINALVYFRDIQIKDSINFIGRDIRWPEIEERLKKAVQNPEQVFGRQPVKELEQKKSRREGKSKGQGL